MISKKVKTLQFLLCLSFFTGCISLKTARRHKKISLANHLAKRMLASIPKRISDSLKPKTGPIVELEQAFTSCDNEYDLYNYFFNVYSENSTHYQDRLNSTEFDYLVKFQNQRGEREEFHEAKAELFKCLNRTRCFEAREIFSKIKAESLTFSNFKDACPYLLYNNEMDECEFMQPDELLDYEESEDFDPSLTWAFGFFLTSIVTLWSWNGLIVFPVIKTKAYKRVLTFMIALAFSCMSTNGILKYVAMADGFFDADLDNFDGTYFYKHIMMLFVIFSFFCFERTMKLFAFWSTQKRETKEKEKMRISIDQKEEKKIFQQRMRQKGLSINFVDIKILGDSGTIILEDISREGDIDKAKLCCTSLTKGISQMKPIGWMAIFGDGLGNFIDGLSIGASINQGITPGLTTAIATWCSNIPQELGDFALLTRAGMTPFQALFYNYLSGNSAYIGCAIGIYFGNNIHSARWIFSISAGTTLFLSLGVLLPEINEEFENCKESLKEKVLITIVQISGMLIGYFIVIMLNIHEEALGDFGV